MLRSIGFDLFSLSKKARIVPRIQSLYKLPKRRLSTLSTQNSPISNGELAIFAWECHAEAWQRLLPIKGISKDAIMSLCFWSGTIVTFGNVLTSGVMTSQPGSNYDLGDWCIDMVIAVGKGSMWFAAAPLFLPLKGLEIVAVPLLYRKEYFIISPWMYPLAKTLVPCGATVFWK